MVPNYASVAAMVSITAILIALAYGMNHSSYLVWGGFWVAPVLLILSLPVAHRAARLDGDAIGRIVLVAAVFKVFAAPVLRYWMAYGLYGGTADATRYHEAGKLLAPLFRQGMYEDLGQISGTRFLEILTGQVYAVTGPTRLGGFMVFSWFSFLGLYLFYRAFRTAYPDGDGRRYAILLFFIPTLFFWPSSIGKDAFMMLVMGVAAVGAAQLVTGRLRGLAWLALGLSCAAVVRPHVALIFAAGVMVAGLIAVLRGSPHGEGRQRSRLGSAVLVMALVLGGSTLVGVAQEFFGLESVNTETAKEQLDEVTRRSAEKGSTFAAISPNSPGGFALATATVLFRPFPGEVRNLQGMMTSLEGLVLLGLCLLALRRLVRWPGETLRQPYVAFATVYTFAFAYAFSSIANFGILARQRAQLLPMLIVILCIPRKGAVDDARSQGEVVR